MWDGILSVRDECGPQKVFLHTTLVWCVWAAEEPPVLTPDLMRSSRRRAARCNFWISPRMAKYFCLYSNVADEMAISLFDYYLASVWSDQTVWFSISVFSDFTKNALSRCAHSRSTPTPRVGTRLQNRFRITLSTPNSSYNEVKHQGINQLLRQQLRVSGIQDMIQPWLRTHIQAFYFNDRLW